jgi:hypothetical protein
LTPSIFLRRTSSYLDKKGEKKRKHHQRMTRSRKRNPFYKTVRGKVMNTLMKKVTGEISMTVGEHRMGVFRTRSTKLPLCDIEIEEEW